MPHNIHRVTSARRATLAFALSLCLLTLLAPPDYIPSMFRPVVKAASTFTVNSSSDDSDVAPGNGTCANSAGLCTLRAAIQEANNSPGDDTINFSVMGTINLTGALPDITSNITVNGPGSNVLTVRRDTGGDYRIFFTNNVNVNISGLRIENGRAPDGVSGNTAGRPGGGIWQAGGSMTLTNIVITGNRTGNGFPGSGSSTGGFGGFGGGIDGSGTLTMTNVVVSGNTTGNGATGYFGGSGGGGGGISFSGDRLTMTNVVVSDNTTGNAGESTSGAMGGNGGSGAGIYAARGTLDLSKVNVSGNNAGTGDDGGGGGGIYTLPDATTTMIDCTISHNSAGRGGSKFASQGGLGGGIVNHGPTKMIGCLVSENTTKGHLPGGGGAGGGGYGGGIYNGNTLTMTNCTISANRAQPDGGRGGGIFNVANSLTLTNVTITGNAAYTCCSFQNGQGIHNSGVVNVRNTVIAGNGSASVPDVTGNYNSQGHNIIGVAKSGASGGSNGDQSGFTNDFNGDRVGTAAAPLDARLGPLADNGGPTRTHALLAGSPALDAGDNALAKDASNNTLTTDQRGAGFARFADSADADQTAIVDIGAFEAQPSVEDVADRVTNEGTQLSFSFGVGDAAIGIASVTASSDNQALVPAANLSLSGTGSARTLQLTPAAFQSGTANITLTVTGSTSRTMSDAFLLTINPVNDAPTFTKGADATVNEDSGPQSFTNWANNISAGPNETSQSLSFLLTGNTNPGLFSVGPSVNSSGTLTFTPADNANGSAAITLVLTDNGGTDNGGRDTSGAQTFTISVNPVNDSPVADGQTITTDEDTPKAITLTGSDAEGGALIFSIVAGPSHGNLSGSGSSRTYTPVKDFYGSDSFTFKAIDANGAESAPATVSITVNALDDVLVLLTEENTERAVALDSVTQTRDPFPLVNPFNFSPDRRTRISLFVWHLGLLPGEDAATVTVQAEDEQGRVYSLPVEYVGTMLGLISVDQIIVKLPEEVVGGPKDLWVRVTLRGASSNRALIKIAAP